MSRILLIILLLGGLVFWWHWQTSPNQTERKKLLIKTLFGVLLVVVVILVASGRMHWFGAVFAGLLAFLRQGMGILVRFFPILTQLYRQFAPSSKPSGTSTVSSKIIEMTLYHDTGKMGGRVLTGNYKGKQLDELKQEDILELFEYCKQTDRDSTRLMESYLAGRFDDDTKFTSDESEQASGKVTSEMTATEALHILGLSETPSREEVVEAYRKIMQQLHPDRGGNDYFAAKINQARDLLLEKFS